MKLILFNLQKKVFSRSIFLLIFLLNLIQSVKAQVPTNDNPCGAIMLSINNVCNNPPTFSNLNASTTTPNGYSLANCAQTLTPKDVWFKVKTSNNASITDTKFAITTIGGAIGQIRIFSTVDCSNPFSLVAEACEFSSNTTTCTFNNAQPNTTYYIMVAGYWDNSPTGNFTICASPPPVSGCINPLASNYNPFATFDNGSCTFTTSPITTCSIFSSSPNTIVTNNAPTTDVINISIGPNKVLTDLDVVLKLNHSFLSDLVVTLTSPSGTTVELFKNICGSYDNLEVRFDDDSYPIQCGNPTKGFYRLPINLLSAFNNEPSDGNWTIKLTDISPGNNGFFMQWCLIPQVKTVTCFPPISLKATNITSNSAALDWNSPNTPQENNWNIELGPRGFSPTGIPTKTATAKPFNYTGLQPFTTYDYYVQAKCLSTLGSSWAGPFSFTTAIPNGQCNLGITIPDNQCNNSNNYLVNVQNAGGTQLGTNVQLEEVRVIIRHGWDSDLSFFLTSPSGKIVELSSKNGQSNDNYGDPNVANCAKYTAFVRNDCAAIPIIGAQAPFIGKYYPEGNLSTFQDGSNPNGNWTLRLCDEAAGFIGRLEYVELIFSSNTCEQPRNVVATNVTDNTMTLNFISQNVNCNRVIVEYGPVGFTPGNGVLSGVGGKVTLVNCPVALPLTLGGLKASSIYDVYVREQCSSSSFSPNSCPITIETKCSTGAITLVENFDNQALCNTVCGDTCAIVGTWHNAKNDDFDWIVNDGATLTTDTGPDDDVTSGGKYAYLEAGTDATCQNGKKAYLMSDCIKVNANADTCAMSFSYHAFGVNINKLALEISTDGGANWLELWSKSGNQGNRWFRQYIDLQLFKNKIVQFRFVGLGGNGIKADLAIDQIEFYGSVSVGTATSAFYRDMDGDGYGDALAGIVGCASTPPTGFVLNNLDCNDLNPDIKPSVAEIPCNKVDENCNGMADDAILPSPIAKADTICIGNAATLKVNSSAVGQFYWYDSPNAKQIINIGDTYVSAALNTNKTFYVKDSTVIKPGLRFTELNLGTVDAVELQNVGIAKDYSGWSVVLGDANLQAITTSWDLGIFAANEVQYRTKLASNNYFGTSWSWNYTAKGFALLLDNQGNPRDFILINASESDFNNLNFTFNTKTYNASNLPWKGAGVNGLCSGINTIQLSTNTEHNDATDYNGCATNSIGGANNTFNLDYPCKSLLVPVNVIVQPFPQLIVPTFPEVCEGKSIDVRNIVVNDVNNTVGAITYHSASPATTANILPSFNMTLFTNTNIVIKKTTKYACSTEQLTTIKVNDLPETNIVASTTMPLCSGQTKNLTATYSGGVAPVNYLWNTGAIMSNIQVGNTFPNLSGFYAVTITDAKGCADSASVDVFKGAGITSAKILNIKDVSSCSGTDGAITLMPIDGTPPYKYTWNGVQVGNIGNVPADYTIENLPKGTYSVTITDSSPLNCELVIPFLVVKSPDVDVKVDSVWSVSCKGKNDAKIFLKNPSLQNFTYLWSNNATSQNITDLSPGNYSVTISSTACSQIISNIVVKEPDSLGLLSALIANVSCTANGKITITPKGGTPNYQYFWSNGVTIKDLTAAPIGNYKVTITDSKGCKFTSPNLEIKAAPALTLSYKVTAAKCFGAASGGIDLTVSGGAHPYTFKWSGGYSTEDLNNIKAGVYFASVTDANGCQVVSLPIQVGQATPLSVIPQIVHTTCKGFADGAIQLATSGGTGNYAYLWSTGANQNEISQLIEGLYKVTINDANNCKVIIDTIKIVAPQVLNVNVAAIQSATCVGKNNGKIDLNVTGGTTPYTFLWSNNATTQNLNNILSGTYNVSISDLKGCKTNLQNLVVGGAQVLALKKDSLVLPTCNAFSDGKIFFDIKNGQTPYTFKWSNNTFNANIFNLKANTYSVTATDINGCQLYKTYQLKEPAPIQIALNSIDSIGCYGAEDAAIDVAISGGTLPYKFFWNSGQNTEDLAAIPAGDYKLTVLDKNNCAITSEAFIVSPSAPLFVEQDKDIQSQCTGATFGNIKIKVTGGKLPYKYLWSNNLTTQNIANVPSGTYSVTVSDFNDCKAVLSNIVILSPLQQLRFDTLEVVNNRCHNDNNAAIFAKILGGQVPFAFSWEGLGEVNFKHLRADTVTNLVAKPYVLVVTDGLGCKITSDTIHIDNPEPINIFIADSNNPQCAGTFTGYIKTSIDGGTPPYSFAWNNNKSTQNIVNLAQGSYSLMVMDKNGCAKMSPSVVLTDPTNSVKISIDSIHNVSCKGGSDGNIFLKTSFGEKPFTYQWSPKPLITSSGKLGNLISGIYNVTVTDSLGCKSKIEFIPVPEPQAIGLLLDTVKQNRCFGMNTASIQVTALGGVPPYKFIWNNGLKTDDIYNLKNGLYKTTISDINNCSFVSNDISISAPDSMSANVTTTIVTMGLNNGTATANVSGGKSPFTYQWNDPQQQNTQTANNLAPGKYDVLITDANGCTLLVKGNIVGTTAADDLDTQAQIEFYPNPSTGDLNVKYQFASWLENTSLVVYDMLGKAIYQKEINSAQDTLLLDLNDLSCGVYMVGFQHEQKVFGLKKVIICP